MRKAEVATHQMQVQAVTVTVELEAPVDTAGAETPGAVMAGLAMGERDAVPPLSRLPGPCRPSRARRYRPIADGADGTN